MDRSERVLDRRTVERAARRLGCEILEQGRRHTAVVLDLSNSGLFVRTHAQPPEGSEVSVLVRRPGGEVWEIEAQVARIRLAEGDSPLISGRGLGLRILKAPPAYYQFLDALTP